MGYASAIGLVTGGVGMGMEMSAQQERASLAKKDVERQELLQAAYIMQARDAAEKSMAQSGSGAFTEEYEKGKENMQRGYQRAESAPTTTAPRNQDIISSTGAKKNAAWAGMTNAMRAPLEGYNEFNLQQQIKNLQTAQTLSMIGQNARASAAVLPLQLQKDAAAQTGRMRWGQLLGMVGSGLSMGGGLASALAPAAGAMAGAGGAGTVLYDGADAGAKAWYNMPYLASAAEGVQG